MASYHAIPVVALLLISFIGKSTSDVSESSLQQVHLVFRHGERTPASTYPNDPYINMTFEPYGWGQLTNVGKMNSYKQGQWIRATYGDFIGEYSSSTVEVHSTQVDRAQMTAATTSAGLFPPTGELIWNQDLLWQPIAMQIQPVKKDRLMLVRGCPRFNQLLSKVLNEPAVKESIEKNRQLYDYLTKYAGVPVENPYGVEDIYSTLKAEVGLNLTLPEWTKSVYPTAMKNEAKKIFTLNTYTTELKRLKGGPLLKKILNDCKTKADGRNGKKLYIYSGHDATVANLLRVLEVWDEQMPSYNAMAIFELHKNQADFILQVKLRNSTNHDPYELQIPGCPHPCSLKQLSDLMTPNLSDDLDKECNSTDADVDTMPDGVQP